MNRDGSEDLLWLGWAASGAMFLIAAMIAMDGVSAPKPNDWPAWVQAVGSVLAILATGYTLLRQERRQEIQGRIDRFTLRGDQLESLTALSTQLEGLIACVRFTPTYWTTVFDVYDWWMVQNAISKIPVHEARDPQIASALMTLRYESDFLHRELKAYGDAELAGSSTHPAWRPSNQKYEGPIIASMGEAIRAHLTLLSRLEGVNAKRRDAEALLRHI